MRTQRAIHHVTVIQLSIKVTVWLILCEGILPLCRYKKYLVIFYGCTQQLDRSRKLGLKYCGFRLHPVLTHSKIESTPPGEKKMNEQPVAEIVPQQSAIAFTPNQTRVKRHHVKMYQNEKSMRLTLCYGIRLFDMLVIFVWHFERTGLRFVTGYTLWASADFYVRVIQPKTMDKH